MLFFHLNSRFFNVIESFRYMSRLQVYPYMTRFTKNESKPNCPISKRHAVADNTIRTRNNCTKEKATIIHKNKQDEQQHVKSASYTLKPTKYHFTKFCHNKKIILEKYFDTTLDDQALWYAEVVSELNEKPSIQDYSAWTNELVMSYYGTHKEHSDIDELIERCTDYMYTDNDSSDEHYYTDWANALADKRNPGWREDNTEQILNEIYTIEQAKLAKKKNKHKKINTSTGYSSMYDEYDSQTVLFNYTKRKKKVKPRKTYNLNQNVTKPQAAHKHKVNDYIQSYTTAPQKPLKRSKKKLSENDKILIQDFLFQMVMFLHKNKVH